MVISCLGQNRLGCQLLEELGGAWKSSRHGEAAPRTVAPPQAPAQPGAYRDPVIWAIALATASAYCVISLSRLIQLNPSSWDLGIYTEYVKQYAGFRAPIVDIRAPGFNLLGDHFTPLAGGPGARSSSVFPSSATLLVAQALLVAVSVFPVAQLAREKLGPGASRGVAVAYGFSWGLQQLADFDFHEIAFAVPLLAFSLSALARGRTRATVWWALPLVFVKEDQGFTVAAIGIYLVLSSLRGHSRRPPGRGRAVPADLGLHLVVPGHRRDHPALQPGSSLLLLEQRRGPVARRAPVTGRPGYAAAGSPGPPSWPPWPCCCCPRRSSPSAPRWR